MKKILFAFLFSISLLVYPLEAQLSESSSSQFNEELVFFTPPAGWKMTESTALPTHVKTMVVGKGPTNFPPSLNLSSEPYKGTLKQYLKIVKNINTAQGYEWKDLGNIQTQAGLGNLSQVDTKTQWGIVRLMHVILVKNGNVYILTASALKDEFSIFYKEFFASMRSLKITKDLYDMIPNAELRKQLKIAVNQLQAQWQSLLLKKQKEEPQTPWNTVQQNIFHEQEFQKTLWMPFQQMLKQKYQQLGPEWSSLFLKNLENQLFNLKPSPS